MYDKKLGFKLYLYKSARNFSSKSNELNILLKINGEKGEIQMVKDK